MKIIIECRDISQLKALSYVSTVVEQGRVSEAGGIKHYCWHTVFRNGVEVSVKRKRSQYAADSFIVRGVKKNAKAT